MKRYCMILSLLAEVCALNAMQETDPAVVRRWFLDRLTEQEALTRRVHTKTSKVASTENFEKMNESPTKGKRKREAVDGEVDSKGGE